VSIILGRSQVGSQLGGGGGWVRKKGGGGCPNIDFDTKESKATEPNAWVPLKL